MKLQDLLVASMLVLSLSLVATPAVAEELSNDSAANPMVEASPAPVAETAPAPVAEATSGKIPKLNIRWDCGDCPMNPKVIPLIEKTYAAEASQNNLALSEEDTADVAIVDFRQRNPANRVLFGLMAGKDRLGVKINYKGKEFLASDYSANILFGMNSLCESVAKSTYHHISAYLEQ
jgi:hypothetical protein